MGENKTLKKYFGTDGFRGEAGVSPTSMQAYQIGRFLGWFYASPLSGCEKGGYRPRIVVGKDTRLSSYMLEYAIAAGITSSGADAYMLHVTTTPSVSYVTRQEGFDCGIMITASHNPFYDNGIKVINRLGEKISDQVTEFIECYLRGDLKSLGIAEDDLPLASGERVGSVVDFVSGRNRYVGYLISLASHSYKDLRIGLDCANGAAWSIAKAVFGALGAKLYLIGAEPNGKNINENCGSTHIERLCALVKEKGLDMGFAFDGDADRCLCVDEKGKVVSGDGILYILARRLKNRGMLNENTVVATVMSNRGLVKSLEKLGIRCQETAVGDRFVYERIKEKDFSLGGEQSGHIIIKKYATTGDGILTAIMMAEEVCDRKSSLSLLAEDMILYPQVTRNVPTENKEKILAEKKVLEKKREIEEKIGSCGRILLRPSGTEPVIRIMIEGEREEEILAYADSLARVMGEGAKI